MTEPAAQPTQTPEEIAAWVEGLSPEAQDKLSNPGVLKLPKDKMQEWIDAEDIYITFRGVVLKLTPVSSFLIHERTSQISYPDVPLKMNEDKGREEPDPFDPDYLRRFQETDTLRAIITMNTYLALGTKVLYVPDDVPNVESNEWAEPLEDKDVLGDYTVKIDPVGTRGRYIQWLRYIAFRDADAIGVPTQIQVLGGHVRTEAVQNALASFPGVTQRGTTGTVAARPNRQQRRNRNRASQ